MKPLAGVTIVDMTTNISGPTLTMILADLGAEVIKVEKPAGDEARKMEPRAGDDGVYFLNINRQKKSVMLNIKDADEKVQLLALIEKADVFVENYRAGVAEKMGLGYEQLQELNKSLIYCSLTAYGQAGPKKMSPGYDAIMQAETGIMSITGSDSLARVPVSLIDQGSAVWGALGVVSALLKRQVTNEGCFVTTSLYETGVFWANYHLLSTKATGENPEKLGSNHGAFAPYGAFETLDGEVMIGISNNSLFERLCHVLGREEWLQDERFNTNEQRVCNREALNKAITELTCELESAAFIQELEEGGVPVAKVRLMLEVLQDPQQIDNEMIVKLPHVKDGQMYATRMPLTFSNCDVRPKEGAPTLGQHNEQFLKKGEGR